VSTTYAAHRAGRELSTTLLRARNLLVSVAVPLHKVQRIYSTNSHAFRRHIAGRCWPVQSRVERSDSQCSARTGSSEWEARRRAWRLDYDRRQKLGAVEGSVAVSTTGQAGRISKSRETLVSLNG
jgi:hypothetical protein